MMKKGFPKESQKSKSDVNISENPFDFGFAKRTVRFRQHSDLNFDTSLTPDIASVDRYHHISKVSPEMVVSGLFSLVMRILHCIVASRLRDVRQRPKYYFLEYFQRLSDCCSDGSICGFRQTGSGGLSTGSSFSRQKVASSCPDAECEGFFCFDSVSVTFVYIVGSHAHRDQAFWPTITTNSSRYATGPLSCL